MDLIQLEEKDLLAMKQSHKETGVAVKRMAPRLLYRSRSYGVVMTARKIHLGMVVIAICMVRCVGSRFQRLYITCTILLETTVLLLDLRRAPKSGIMLYSKRLHAKGLLLVIYCNYFGLGFY